MPFLLGRMAGKLRPVGDLTALMILFMLLVLVSMLTGRYALGPGELFLVIKNAITGNHGPPDVSYIIIWMIRVPRVVTAIMAGAGLAIAGASFQSLFRNPMASPSLLGVSSGAGFGASIALLFHQDGFTVQAAAFAGGLVAVVVALLVNRTISGSSVVTLILCGMVMSALFQALITMVKYVADPTDVLASITFWLMGSLAKASARDAWTVSIAVSLCGLILYLNRWRISLLSLGEEEANALGVDVHATRMLTIVCATIISATIVSVAGIVGWVGLLIPHVARILFGLEPRRLFPATALLGASFLLGIDDLARSLSVVEIPLGVLTAVAGAPFFFALLLRSRGGAWA